MYTVIKEKRNMIVQIRRRKRKKKKEKKKEKEKKNHTCNRVHLHIVFVLLHSVCRSVSVLSCVDVIRSFTYVLRVVILTSLKEGVREGERKREGRTTTPRMYHPKEKKK